MSPFAVANKSYSVNDRLAFEAQLINAVILRRAPIKGRFRISYTGDGGQRRCRVEATLTDGDVVDYESPPIDKIPVKNSPLWKGDPDQQLFYYSSRAMCRRHFPDVLLGIYSPDEIEIEERTATGREVLADSPAAGMAAMLAGTSQTKEPAPEAQPAPRTRATKKPVDAPAAAPITQAAQDEGETLRLLDELGYQRPEFIEAVRFLGITPARELSGISETEWRVALSRWTEVKRAMDEERPAAAGDGEEAA